MLKESAYALGSTTWEVVSKVVLPYTKTGVVGGIMLGLGRALGETMAVTFVIGNFNQLDSLSLFQAANSITSALANEFAEAGAGSASGVADLPGPGAVLHHLRGAGLVETAADATEEERGDPNMSAVAPVSGPSHATLSAGKMARHRARKRMNVIALVLSMAAMGFGLFWLAWILFETIWLGIGGIGLSVFTEMTPPPIAETGGLANAIFGSAVMVTLATLLGTPIGILAGIYLGEYGQKTWLGNVVRFINDILLSAPSIVIGLFIYAVVVAPLRGFSAFAGVLALALIVIPVVIRTTENMLTLIPNALREAAYALGTPKWKVISSVTLKAARAGVLTGILLALARIAGETAPLLFTALSNQFWTSDLTQPMASLPVTIFKFAMSPYENWQKLAWAGVFLITLGVLLLNILARILFKNKH